MRGAPVGGVREVLVPRLKRGLKEKRRAMEKEKKKRGGEHKALLQAASGVITSRETPEGKGETRKRGKEMIAKEEWKRASHQVCSDRKLEGK